MPEELSEVPRLEMKSVEPEEGLIDLFEEAREHQLFIRIFRPNEGPERYVAAVGEIQVAEEIFSEEDPNLLTLEECRMFTIPGIGQTQREAITQALEIRLSRNDEL